MRTKDENKELAIRKEALEMIVEVGFDGLSMQKLAKAANVSPATIYLYFKNREDLIQQIYNELSGKMLIATLQNFNPDMSFKEGMKIQWQNRAKYMIEHPLEMKFLEQFKHSPFHERAMSDQEKTFREAMKTFVQNARANNELIELPFELYWSVAYAPLYQLVKFNTQGKSYLSPKFTLTNKHLDQALALVLKALKP